MVSTSNTYNFGDNTQVDDLIREAFERIGIIGNDVTGLNIQSAIMSANLELSSWAGKGINLWMLRKRMLQLVANQPFYQLPSSTIRVMDVVATQPKRLNAGGTAFSTDGGNAGNCFDPSQTTGCIQTSSNGSIGYDYGIGNSNSILYVGVIPLEDAEYTLSIDYSFDNITYAKLYEAPKDFYNAGQTIWFVISDSLSARGWQISENGGATLKIQQIYFSQPSQFSRGDTLMDTMSRNQWMSLSNKMNPSSPTSYYFDQEIIPTLKVWPVPTLRNNEATHILYTQYSYAQDITKLFQLAAVPLKFYDALVAALAARLSLKFAPDRYSLLKADAQEAYNLAGMTDFENVVLSINPDFGGM